MQSKGKGNNDRGLIIAILNQARLDGDKDYLCNKSPDLVYLLNAINVDPDNFISIARRHFNVK